jgi:hypothetical protein
MAQDIVQGYKLYLPAQSLKYVLLLHDEFVISERDPRVVDQLTDATVGLFQVLRADKQTDQGDQGYDIVF